MVTQIIWAFELKQPLRYTKSSHFSRKPEGVFCSVLSFWIKKKKKLLVSGTIEILPILNIMGNNRMYKMLSGKILYHLCIKVYLLSYKQIQSIRQSKINIKKPIRGQKKENKADQLQICFNLTLSLRSTHHNNIWVNFVNLRKEKSQQCSLCCSNFYFSILKGAREHLISMTQ